MRNRFDRQLEQLHTEMIQMGAYCEQVISAAYKVISENDRASAKAIMDKDNVIDMQERKIESICMRLLLQQQPVARDLRKISAALKMITDMERIGDQGADIAEIIVTGQNNKIAQLPLIGKMAEATTVMVTKSVDAYVKQDLQLVQEVIDADDEVDRLFEETRESLAAAIGMGAASAAAAMDYLMIAKYFERIGDHAVNLAEWVAFSITGRHEGEEDQ